MTARRLKASAALQAVGLGDRLTHYPGQLSGGEEQRVAFARAVVNDPEVVVADEPTGNLDSQAQSQIAKTLLGLRASGRTIVMATHNTDMADLADRRFGLADGRITSSD